MIMCIVIYEVMLQIFFFERYVSHGQLDIGFSTDTGAM